MIKLNADTFRNAIQKAQKIQPVCKCVDDAGTGWVFRVARSSGSFAIVDLWVQGGVLWSSCDCFAGVGHGREGAPLPCYHVAAAALSLGLLHSVPAPVVDVSYVIPGAVPASVVSPAVVSTSASKVMTDVEHSRLAAAVRSFGRRVRGVVARRGWFVGASARA